jgi:hypothetical protein
VAYKSLFTETADKEIEEGGIHFIYHNGADVKPELTEYESNAMGQGTSITLAIKDAVTKLAKAHGWKKANIDYLTTKVTKIAEKAGYDVISNISPKQQFLPGIPKKFTKGLHFVEVALDDDFVGEVVEAIIKFINDGEENAIQYYSGDGAEYYIDHALEQKSIQRMAPQIEEKLEALEMSEEDFLDKVDESDLEAEYYGSNYYQNIGGVILGSYEVGEYEDQIDDDHMITTPFGEVSFVDAVASLTPEQFKEVNMKSNGYISEYSYKSAQNKAEKYRNITVIYNLGGSVEVWLPAEKALEILASSKIGKVRALKKLAQESYKPYRRIFT